MHLTISPDFRPKPYGLDVDSIEKYLYNHISHNPAFLIDTRDFTQEIDRLKTERDKEVYKARQLAAAEEAQVRSQLDKVREKAAIRIQEIETVYVAKLDDARSRYAEILTSRPQSSTGICMCSSRTSTLGSGVRAESLADNAPNTPLQTSDHSMRVASFQAATDELDGSNIWPQQENGFLSQAMLQPSSDGNLDISLQESELFESFLRPM